MYTTCIKPNQIINISQNETYHRKESITAINLNKDYVVIKCKKGIPVKVKTS